MAWGEVYVEGPDDEDVYINGNYEQSAGPTNTTYTVEYGPNTFETLDHNGNVVLRATIVVGGNNRYSKVVLQASTSNESGDKS